MMTAVLCVVTVLIALVCSVCSVWYQGVYIAEVKSPCIETLKKDRLLLIILAIAFTAMSVFSVLMQESKNMRSDILIQNLLIWNGVCTAAVIDYKVKKIPNAIVLYVLIVRALFMIFGIIFENDSVRGELIRSVVGMAIGGGVFLICMFFSKGGIGAGDMKLYAAIGFCFSLTGLIQVMIYSMFISAVVCIGLLIFQKAKMRSTVPMAPFILVGLTVYFIFLSYVE